MKISTEGARRAALQQLQTQMDNERQRQREVLQEMEATGQKLTLEEICRKLYPTSPRKSVFRFLQEQVKRQQEMQRHGTAQTYSSALRSFRNFRQNIDLTFAEITPDPMERYETWLLNRRLKQNSICCYLRTLSTMLHKGAEEVQPVEADLFARVRLTYAKTQKRAIGLSELRAIAQLPLPANSSQALARDMDISVAVISEGMSHTSLRTTQVYLSCLETSRIDKANHRIIRKVAGGGL